MDGREREAVAIATVLREMGECSYQDVAERAGNGLASRLMEMVRDGVVLRQEPGSGRPALYRMRP